MAITRKYINDRNIVASPLYPEIYPTSPLPVKNDAILVIAII